MALVELDVTIVQNTVLSLINAQGAETKLGARLLCALKC